MERTFSIGTTTLVSLMAADRRSSPRHGASTGHGPRRQVPNAAACWLLEEAEGNAAAGRDNEAARDQPARIPVLSMS